MSIKSRRRAVELIATRTPVRMQEPEDAQNLTDLYECDTYGIQAMRETLPSHCFKKLREVMHAGKELDPELADMVANGLKEWALKKGASHYTHWFQPLTGSAAEKHDSFINIFPGDERLLLEFGGMQLIRGEPDASSFPSGGLRSTWEARGYTVWDATSPAFIRKGENGSVLCIPTAFCSWTGLALDQKTPLLRSMEVLSAEASHLLRLMGEKCDRVFPTLGCEQEFFLIDRGFYLARPDLMACGRTLLGAKPPKGQELEDHYFGTMNPRILACLQEVEWLMWRLGAPMKTRHNEVAPAQYEMAPIFERSNVAGDHNMVLMEALRSTAARHGLVCLLHEKPFAGVNGSGKHNNWSMSTDTGVNLLDPGHTPAQNARFILFLTAVIRAVDVHADLLRCSVACPGNEHRLGANEAPPAIISIYLGDSLDHVVRDIIGMAPHKPADPNSKHDHIMKLGVNTIPSLPRDLSDRNRTSPFAFTGNKFEFRAVGSSQVVAFPNIVLNTIVAESIRYLITSIEEHIARTKKSFQDSMQDVVEQVLKKHYRIVFNGDGYSEEWKEEAKKRGLLNLRTTPDGIQVLSDEKNLELFESMKVLSRAEVKSRQHIMYETYDKLMVIEAKSLHDLATTSVLPASLQYQKRVADSYLALKETLGQDSLGSQKNYLLEVSSQVDGLLRSSSALKAAIDGLHKVEDEVALAAYIHKSIIPNMETARSCCDKLESLVDDELWPLPKYSEMLFMR